MNDCFFEGIMFSMAGNVPMPSRLGRPQSHLRRLGVPKEVQHDSTA
jgi:hypothetical protein